MSAMQQSLIATAAALADTLDTPQFVVAGTFTSSINAISIPAPPAYINDDLLILIVTSANQTIADPTTGGTWTQVTNSPQGTGTAAASQSIRCQVYYKLASGTQAAADVADSGSITTGQMFVFRKVNNTTPINVTAGSVLATAGTTHTLPSITTTSNNVMVAHCTGIGRDAVSFVNYSSPTNANLTGLTVQDSRTVADGAGGGVGLVTGVKTTSGSTGTTSVTVQAAAKGAFVTVGVAPSTNYDSTNRVIGSYGVVYDVQTFIGGDDALASLTLNTDGTLTCVGNQSIISTGWYSTTSTGIGSSYWVRATTVTGSGTGTTGSWLQLNTARTWSVSALAGGALGLWVIKLEYSTDSGGSTIVATTRVNLQAETEGAPTVGTVGTVGVIP